MFRPVCRIIVPISRPAINLSQHKIYGVEVYCIQVIVFKCVRKVVDDELTFNYLTG